MRRQHIISGSFLEIYGEEGHVTLKKYMFQNKLLWNQTFCEVKLDQAFVVKRNLNKTVFCITELNKLSNVILLSDSIWL